MSTYAEAEALDYHSQATAEAENNCLQAEAPSDPAEAEARAAEAKSCCFQAEVSTDAEAEAPDYHI